MTGIALIVRFDGAPAAPHDLAPVLAAQDHRGDAGCDVLSLGAAVLAHQHGGLTAGGRQPVPCGGGARLLFDGRLDNRRELAAALGLASTAGAAGDPALAAAAWERWGADCFRRFRGPFVAAVWEPWHRRLTCARDPLGERTLAYHHDAARDLFLAASEEGALLAHGALGELDAESLDHDALDHDSLARFLAVEPPQPGATFHVAVRELPAGYLLTVDERGARLRGYGAALPSAEAPRPRFGDDEWEQRFRAVLAAAVAAALPDDGPVGVMLSGGLDSSSVAVLAAEQRRATGGPPPVAFSWIFADPALAACDERPWIEAVAQGAGMVVHPVAADDAWPLVGAGCGGSPGLPLTRLCEPPGNPYRPLKQRLYAAARERGVRVLLAGAGGDLLWTGGRRGWLADLLADGRWSTAGAELAAAVVARRYGSVRAAAAGLLPPLHRRPQRPWLLPETAARVAAGDAPPVTGTADWRLRNLTGARAARGFSAEAAWARRAGVELRDPFRDRRLVELAMQLPAHLLHRRGEDKYLLRRALADLLPDAVRRRRGSAPLGPLFRRGVSERERHSVETLLAGGELWRRHVDETWMRRALDELPRGTLRGAPAVALWRAVAVELWLATRAAGRAAPPRPADGFRGTVLQRVGGGR